MAQVALPGSLTYTFFPMKTRFLKHSAISQQLTNPRWLIALPLFLTVAGCNAQDNTPAAEEVPTPPVEMKSDAPAADKAESADAGKPDPAYKVVNEAQPGLPPAAISALDKVKVSPPPAGKAPKTAKVRLVTSKGPIVVELNGEAAPLHVKSFLHLSKMGFYDKTVLHRYEPGFVIQGGDPLTKNPALKEYAGIGGPGYQVPRERNSLKHDAFVFAAARSQDPNSAGSQFYITLASAPFLDEGDGYTVYGKVVEGRDTVLKLRADDKLNKVEILK